MCVVLGFILELGLNVSAEQILENHSLLAQLSEILKPLTSVLGDVVVFFSLLKDWGSCQGNAILTHQENLSGGSRGGGG